MRMTHRLAAAVTAAAVTTAMVTTAMVTTLTVGSATGAMAAAPASAADGEITVTLRVQVAHPAGAFIDSFVTNVVNTRGGIYQDSCDYLAAGVTEKIVTTRPGEQVYVRATTDCYAVVGNRQTFDVTAQNNSFDVFLRADRTR